MQVRQQAMHWLAGTDHAEQPQPLKSDPKVLGNGACPLSAGSLAGAVEFDGIQRAILVDRYLFAGRAILGARADVYECRHLKSRSDLYPCAGRPDIGVEHRLHVSLIGSHTIGGTVI